MPGVHGMGWLVVLAAAAAAPKAPRVVDRIEAFKPDQHLVATYYFNWYVDGRTFKYHDFKTDPDPVADAVRWAWQPFYPSGQDVGAVVFGLHDPAAWPGRRLPNTSTWPDSDDWLYHVAELRAMKYVGVDFAFVDIWWPHDFYKEDGPAAGGEVAGAGAKRPRAAPAAAAGGRAGVKGPTAAKVKKGAPRAELAALFRAWKYLDQRGEQPVRLAMTLETPSFANADVRGSPLGKPELLYEPIWAFYRQFLGSNDYPAVMPRRAIAAIEDARKRPRLIVNLFYPRAHGERGGEWISRWDAGTFRELRSRFEGMVGLPLYICVNQHLHGPRYGGWDGVQKDGSIIEISRRAGIVDQEITWHASLNGPRFREDSVSIGYGYFKPHAGDKRPGGDAKLADGSPAYPRAYRFLREDDNVGTVERQWREVLSSPVGFQKHLLVLECWNELAEGTQLSPSRPEVLRDERGAYVDRWGDSPTMYLDMTRRFVAMWKGLEPVPLSAAPATRPAASQPTERKPAARPGTKSRRPRR